MVIKEVGVTPAGDQIPVIMSEMQVAADTLAHIGPAVAIFGSARTPREAPIYLRGEEIAAALARAGFAIIAGGGPGLMEAANKGAFEARGTSIGLNLILPHETKNNDYQSVSLSFEFFYSRKATFFMHSFAYIALPGGFGTLDELFEALTLIQTGKVPPAPVILVGKQFWSGLVDWLRDEVHRNHMIAEHDLDLFLVEDDPQSVVQAVLAHHEKATSSTRLEPSLPA
jgi:uncharacterized protein (TIGR00730 family)